MTTPRRPMRRLQALVATLIIAGGALLGAGQASAHASLIGSTPVYGSTIKAAPTTVALQFDNLVEPGLVKVRLKDGNDEEVGKGTLVGDRSPRASVEFSLPAHGEGKFLITWVSFAFDGHVVSGTIPYTVDPNAEEGGSTPVPQPLEPGTGGGEANRIIDIVEIQLRFLQYLSLAALVGGALWLACTNGSGSSSSLMRRNARTFAVAGGYAGAAFALGRVGSGVWRFLDGGYETSAILERIIDGQLGAGIVASAAFAAAGAVVANRVRIEAVNVAADGTDGAGPDETLPQAEKAGHGAAMAAVMALAAAGAMLSAAVGHGAAAPVPGVNAVMMGMHLFAASVWVGGVMLLAYVASEKSFSADVERWGELRDAVRRVSQAFLVAAPVLYLTGMRAGYVYSDGIPDGRWGLTLAAKLVLVAGASVIGLIHYRRGRRGQGFSGATLGIEASLLVLTLTAAAVLSVTTI